MTHLSPPRAFVPSPEQSRVFSWVELNARLKGTCAIIRAVAGSGKTTTIIKCLRHIPEWQSVIFVAFNASIAKELKERIVKELGEGHRRKVRASTFHGVGFKALNDFARGRKWELNKSKVGSIASKLIPEVAQEIYLQFCTKLVSYAKGQGIGVEGMIEDTDDAWWDIIDHQAMELPVDEPDEEKEAALYMKAVDFARDILRRSNEVAKAALYIDFDDQIYLPLLWKLPLEKFDWVIPDEGQDTNPVRREMCKRMFVGHLLMVGDPCQSIYGFTGATPEAMDLVEKEFRCTKLELNYSYRCPQDVVRMAQKYVPYIQAHPSAARGEVLDSRDEDYQWTDKDFGPDDAILCRLSAPLVQKAYALIAQRIPCVILGRDIGQGLVSLVKNMKAKDIDELHVKLYEYRKREVEKAKADENEKKAESINDKVDCIYAIMENLPPDAKSVDALIAEIEGLFSDDSKGKLTLSTVHKAKGKEWETVMILNHWLMPSSRAKQDWEIQQEYNIIYVAYTRAKFRLIIN